MLDPRRLQSFALLDTLSQEGLAKAAAQMEVRDLAPGDVLFHQGERDRAIHFLLDGSLALRADRGGAVVIDSGTEAAAMPVSRLKPRRYTAIALGHARVAAIDEDQLDRLLTVDQSAAYEVSLIEGEDPEWMFRLFSNDTLRRIPVAHLTALFGRLEPVPVVAGQVVVREGEPGDYYYLIRRGRAAVDRRQDGAPARVAELGIGDGFGEEALLSGEPRNATVTMLEDGLLMRLSQTDFDSLLQAPLVRRVDPAEALAMVGEGARFIDVRTEAEQREHPVPGSLSLPLCDLRRLLVGLPHGGRYITVCQTGRRSTAAAFLLGQRGFDAYVLAGGLDALHQADDMHFPVGK